MTSKLISGGARGADQTFAIHAFHAGHDIVHYSFKGHKVKGPGDIVIMGENQYELADFLIGKCNKTLERNINGMAEHSFNLLRRNMIKVYENVIGSLYAVSYLTEEGKVPGGTAWATTLFNILDKGPMYLFNQGDNTWYESDVFGRFHIMKELPPTPEGTYLGIGSRDITNEGKNAISELYREISDI